MLLIIQMANGKIYLEHPLLMIIIPYHGCYTVEKHESTSEKAWINDQSDGILKAWRLGELIGIIKR